MEKVNFPRMDQCRGRPQALVTEGNRQIGPFSQRVRDLPTVLRLQDP